MTNPSKPRKENTELMMLFSTYEEYQDYLYDFYVRDWSSIQQNFGENPIPTPDECWQQYFAEYNNCCKYEEDSDATDELSYSEGQEEPYMKNRAQRSQRRRKSAQHRKRDEHIAFILGKKAEKEERESTAFHNSRPSATLYKRANVLLITEEAALSGCEVEETCSGTDYSINLLEHATRTPKCYSKRVIAWEKRISRLHRSESKNPSSILEEASVDSKESDTTYVSEEHGLYVNRTVQIATDGSSVPCKFISPLKVSKEIPVFMRTGIVPCIMPFSHVRQSYFGMI